MTKSPTCSCAVPLVWGICGKKNCQYRWRPDCCHHCGLTIPSPKCGNCHQDHHGQTVCGTGKFLDPLPSPMKEVGMKNPFDWDDQLKENNRMKEVGGGEGGLIENYVNIPAS